MADTLPMAGFWWYVMVRGANNADPQKWSCWSRGRSLRGAHRMEMWADGLSWATGIAVVEAQSADHARQKLRRARSAMGLPPKKGA